MDKNARFAQRIERTRTQALRLREQLKDKEADLRTLVKKHEQFLRTEVRSETPRVAVKRGIASPGGSLKR